MFYNKEIGGQYHRFRENLSHTVLIPRSHKAKVYHDIGFALKVIFLIWGFIMAMYLEKNILLGEGDCGSGVLSLTSANVNVESLKFITEPFHSAIKLTVEFIADGELFRKAYYLE